MATVYVAEFAGVGATPPAVAQAAKYPVLAEDTVAIGSASAASAAFSDQTRLIRVHTDAICSIAIGANPTATSANARMAADQTEYFAVEPGHKIAVITNS